MRMIVIGGFVLGALVVGGCDDKPSGGNAAASASASAAAAPASAAAAPSSSAKAEPEKKDKEKKEKAEAPKDHKARTKSVADAWATHDAKKVAALYSETAVIKSAGHADVKGREAIEKHTAETFAAFKDMTIIPGRVWEKDKHTALVEWVGKGTNTGEMPSADIKKATNKPFGVVGASWVEVDDDGLIKEEQVFLDSPTMIGQVKEEKKIRAVVNAAPDGVDHFESATEKLKDAKDEKEKKDLAKAAEGEKKNVETEDKILEHLNGHKADDALKLVGDDYKLVDYRQEKDLDKKGYKENVHTWLTSFPDLKVKSEGAFPAGDFVVESLEYTGVQKGPFMGIKASNKPVTVHEVQVNQFKDGKLVKSWSFGNNAELYEAIAEKKEEKKEEKKK